MSAIVMVIMSYKRRWAVRLLKPVSLFFVRQIVYSSLPSLSDRRVLISHVSVKIHRALKFTGLLDEAKIRGNEPHEFDTAVPPTSPSPRWSAAPLLSFDTQPGRRNDSRFVLYPSLGAEKARYHTGRGKRGEQLGFEL